MRSERAGTPRFLSALAGVLWLAGCSSIEVPDERRPAPAPLVSGLALANELQLRHVPMDDDGKVALVGNGAAIHLFPETTVATVHGRRFTASEEIALREDDALLVEDDAAAIRSLWLSGLVARRDVDSPPVRPAQPETVRPSQPKPTRGDQPTAAEVRQWSVPLRAPWRYIVIHHSATEGGSAALFDEAHRKKGWDGLGYDFVIGNGKGATDGLVEVGWRWREQKVGAHAGNKLMNEQGIGICLVGDFTRTRPTWAQMRALTRLCNFLSAYCGIPRENYRLHGDVRDTTCPGPLFPRDFLGPRGTGGAAAVRSGTTVDRN
jgi:hypothetical protein